MKGTLFIAVAFVACVVGRTAQAQTPCDDETRRRLIEEGGAARDRGDHAVALERAETAGRCRMTPSLRQFISEEQRALGRDADALASARQCLAEAEADRTARYRREVIRVCTRLVRELEPRVAATPSPPPPSPPPPPPPPPPAEPVTTPPQRTPTQNVPVDAGSAVRVANGPPPIEPARARSRLPNAGQWVVAGAGAAMLGGALATWLAEDGLRAEQDAATVRSDATTRYCATPRCVELDGERATLQVVNNVLFFGGLAAVTGAAVWYLVTQLRPPERAASGLSFQLTPSRTGVLWGVRGTL